MCSDKLGYSEHQDIKHMNIPTVLSSRLNLAFIRSLAAGAASGLAIITAQKSRLLVK